MIVPILRPDQKLPREWKKFMSSSMNTTSLVDFLCQQWRAPGFAPALHHRSLFLCHSHECMKRTSYDSLVVTADDIPSLTCHQEEVDTCLFLHALHAAQNGHNAIIVKSPDAHVAAIGCSLADQIPAELIWPSGSRLRQRYVSLSEIASALGPGVCEALPGMHAFTGCDSTSAFAGKGKKSSI